MEVGGSHKKQGAGRNGIGNSIDFIAAGAPENVFHFEILMLMRVKVPGHLALCRVDHIIFDQGNAPVDLHGTLLSLSVTTIISKYLKKRNIFHKNYARN